jgi:hypothetical protein
MRLFPWVLLFASLFANGCGVLMEDSFNQSAAQQVVAAVASGALKSDRDGEIALPARWASLTRTGKVYVTRDRDGTRRMLFPTWEGKGGNVRGYVYSSRPITTDTIGLRYFAFLTRSGPYHSAPSPNTVNVDRKITANWYHVHYDMD